MKKRNGVDVKEKRSEKQKRERETKNRTSARTKEDWASVHC